MITTVPATGGLYYITPPPSTCQGWEVSIALNMHCFNDCVLSEEERQRVRELELFDEFEVSQSFGARNFC